MIQTVSGHAISQASIIMAPNNSSESEKEYDKLSRHIDKGFDENTCYYVCFSELSHQV